MIILFYIEWTYYMLTAIYQNHNHPYLGYENLVKKINRFNQQKGLLGKKKVNRL